jgi:hypothetical protein
VAVVPPDTVPRRIYNPENYVTQGGITYLRDIVVIHFVRTASAEERRCAIDLVRGRVVGGVRYGGVDGEYFVRIDAQDSGAALRRAMDVLQRLPQVAGVRPEYVDAYGPI